MTGFNHGMTGAVIALAIRQPAAAIPLSFISHYAADYIPHFGLPQHEVLGSKFNKLLAADFIIGLICLVTICLLFPSQWPLVLACMAAATSPDLIWWFYRKTVKAWPAGLDSFTAWHYGVNMKSHVGHWYYDAIWFIGMWLVILIWLR